MFKAKLNYQFKNNSLLTEALTHKSYSIELNKDKPHNERLEFLGDAILNLVIAADLVKKYPFEFEGYLSKKRAGLVNQVTLAELARSLQLQQEIHFGPGEVKQGSPLNPRLLASTLEALIGAIFLDSNYSVAEKWILDLFSGISDDVYASISTDTDYKTKLQELTQKNKLGTPLYELVLKMGPSHKPHFIVCLKLDDKEKARAEGPSKKAAEQKAAEIYLKELEIELRSQKGELT